MTVKWRGSRQVSVREEELMRRILAAIVIAAAATTAQAQSDERVAAYKDWSVFNPSNPKECYIVSPPVNTAARRGGNSVTVNRGEIRLFVTIRPEQGVNKEVSYTGGYPFRDGSTVDVKIGNNSFTMNVGSGNSKEWAWPPTPTKDAELIAAMQVGASAKITAISARGTTTIDDFSLLGFTAALKEAEKLCK